MSVKSLHIDGDWENFLAFREQRLSGFKTDFPRLDRALLGLSGIVGIQGSPGSCKSTLALQIASQNAANGTPVLIIDRENGKHRFKLRLMCQVNRVCQDEILKCPTDRLRRYANSIKNLPVFVDCSQDISPETISSNVAELIELFKRPVLMVIDSLQALPRNGVEERIALQNWLGAFDQLKLDFNSNLVMLMTSEKRRGVYTEASNDAGKGTGAIEYKCETLIDIRPLEPNSPTFVVEIVKNRDGAMGELIYLQKVMANGNFTYKLEEAGDPNL